MSRTPINPILDDEESREVSNEVFPDGSLEAERIDV
jgi:hypothetical protein